MRPPAIRDARKLCKDMGARGVIVLAFDHDRFGGASYGTTKAECSALGALLDAFCDAIASGAIQIQMPGDSGYGPPRWECTACGRAKEERCDQGDGLCV